MLKKPKGTEDILPVNIDKWHYVEDTARAVLESYNFKEIRTPLFESFDLFHRSVGDSTDIVSKEMYDFMDKGKRHMALRPEGTAPIARAYIEHKLYGPEHAQPLKVYYMEPMFRYERPQAGRQRQFHQLGIEVFGSNNPATDVEGIALAMDLFDELGLSNLTLHINSLGKPEEREAYRNALIEYFTPLKDQLSEDSQRRLTDNPMRIIDSKDERDKALVADAPIILDFLGEESQKHFDEVQFLLKELDIPFEVTPSIVRGLDYYQDTIFEILVTDDSIGSQSTVCGGGRYDGLVEQLGGPKTPGFGFGIGLERLMLLLENQEVEVPESEGLDIFVMSLGEKANAMSLKVVQAARKDGLNADRDYLNRSMKSQFKTADKLKTTLVFTIGEQEVESGKVQVKHQGTGKQTELSFEELMEDFMGQYRKLTVDTSAIDKYFGGTY